MTIFTQVRQRLQKYSFLIRYGISGVFGAILQTFVLYVWVSVLGLEAEYLWGVVAGFCIAVVVTFLLQKYWTFADRVQHHMTHRQFVLYVFFALVSLALNTILLYVSKLVIEGLNFNFFHVWYLVAQIIIIFIAAVFSFFLNYFVTFKTRNITL